MTRDVTRRSALMATAGALVSLAGCSSEEGEGQPQAKTTLIPLDGNNSGCVESVSVSRYTSSSFVISGEVELQITLSQGHGYGELRLETGEAGGDDEEYETTIKTITPSHDEVKVQMEGTPKYTHLTAACNGHDSEKAIIQLEEL